MTKQLQVRAEAALADADFVLQPQTPMRQVSITYDASQLIRTLASLLREALKEEK